MGYLCNAYQGHVCTNQRQFAVHGSDAQVLSLLQAEHVDQIASTEHDLSAHEYAHGIVFVSTSVVLEDCKDICGVFQVDSRFEVHKFERCNLLHLLLVRKFFVMTFDVKFK